MQSSLLLMFADRRMDLEDSSGSLTAGDRGHSDSIYNNMLIRKCRSVVSFKGRFGLITTIYSDFSIQHQWQRYTRELSLLLFSRRVFLARYPSSICDYAKCFVFITPVPQQSDPSFPLVHWTFCRRYKTNPVVNLSILCQIYSSRDFYLSLLSVYQLLSIY